jgi:hypothetical protein
VSGFVFPSDPSDLPRRRIITEFPHPENPDRQNYGVEEVSYHGEIERLASPATEAADAEAAWEVCRRLVEALEPLIGWSHMDDILSAVNTVQQATRVEAFARMVAAGVEMMGWPVAVIVLTEPKPKEEESTS